MWRPQGAGRPPAGWESLWALRDKYMLMSQVPYLSVSVREWACVCVCVCVCVNPNGGIQYRIKLGQPGLILLTELGWPKKAWGAGKQWKLKEEGRASRTAAEMANKRKEINVDGFKTSESEQTGKWLDSSCKVEDEEEQIRFFLFPSSPRQVRIQTGWPVKYWAQHVFHSVDRWTGWGSTKWDPVADWMLLFCLNHKGQNCPTSEEDWWAFSCRSFLGLWLCHAWKMTSLM